MERIKILLLTVILVLITSGASIAQPPARVAVAKVFEKEISWISINSRVFQQRSAG